MKLHGKKNGMGKFFSVIIVVIVVELEYCLLEIFLPISCVTEEIIEGRLLKIQAVFENVKLTFINVYAPTVGTERVVF